MNAIIRWPSGYTQMRADAPGLTMFLMDLIKRRISYSVEFVTE